MAVQIKKAKKELAFLKVALTGPSGSGKTLSALILAKSFGGKTLVIDTENNSACLYVGRAELEDWEFDIIEIEPPYTAQKYFEAIDAGTKAKYDNIVIDSLTHVWAGEGGLLQQKDAIDLRGGNQWTNWASITKLHEQLKSRLLYSNVHMILTMRSKQEYILESNDKGKQAPRKVGLAPVQREGMEYEFTTVLDIAMDHQFVASKDRTGLFNGVTEMVTEKTGHQLLSWLSNADRTLRAPPAPPTPPERPNVPPPKQGQSRSPQQQQQPKQPPPKDGVRRDHSGKEVFHPGDYVVIINSKAMFGKPLCKCDDRVIKSTLDWVNDAAKKPLSPQLREFQQYATDYLSILRSETPLDVPEFAPDEAIPDFSDEPPPGPPLASANGNNDIDSQSQVTEAAGS